MMLDMAHGKRLSEFGSAAIACIIAIAFLAGPVCAPACSGMPCYARPTAAAESAHCHGMSGHSGSQYDVRATGNACTLANVTLAIVGRPVAHELGMAARGAQLVSAAPSVNAPPIEDTAGLLSDSSTGSAPALRSETVSASILRI